MIRFQPASQTADGKEHLGAVAGIAVPGAPEARQLALALVLEGGSALELVHHALPRPRDASGLPAARELEADRFAPGR